MSETYSLDYLPVISGSGITGYGYSLSASGQLYGYSIAYSNNHYYETSFLLNEDGSTTVISDPLASTSLFYNGTLIDGVTDDGTVYGRYGDASGEHTFTEKNGVYTTVDQGDSIIGITDDGYLITYSTTPGTRYTPASSSSDVSYNGSFIASFAGTLLSYASDGTAYAIVQPTGYNNVIGYEVESDGQYRYFYGPASTTTVTFIGMSSDGFFYGNYTDTGGVHGFIQTTDTTKQVSAINDPLATSGTFLTDANSSGVIVGYYKDASGEHGFVDDNGSFTTIDAAGAVNGTVITSISDSGEIFGYYYDANNKQHYFTGTEDVATCYRRETKIATQNGFRAVEDLKIGDHVLTRFGGLSPVKWIGRRSYAGRFLKGKRDILPICFKAGSITETVPVRDLWVSPHHAMYIDGVLIEARDLVNGISIVQDRRAEQVDYFHVELEGHDVIMAEGAWSESYLNDDNRGIFHNAHEYAALYPGELESLVRYCAPRVRSGAILEQVRTRLAGASQIKIAS